MAKEALADHPLYERTAVSVARRIDNDDVLFFLPDNEPPFAVVHLTWKGSPESSPQWPETTFFRSLVDWVENGMKVDHLDYGDGHK